MPKLILFLTISFILSISANALALQDSEVKAMAAESPEFAKAEEEVMIAWKAVPADTKTKIRAEQIKWINTERDLEANALIAKGSSKTAAYTEVTRRKAAYLRSYSQKTAAPETTPAPPTDSSEKKEPQASNKTSDPAKNSQVPVAAKAEPKAQDLAPVPLAKEAKEPAETPNKALLPQEKSQEPNPTAPDSAQADPKSSDPAEFLPDDPYLDTTQSAITPKIVMAIEPPQSPASKTELNAASPPGADASPDLSRKIADCQIHFASADILSDLNGTGQWLASHYEGQEELPTYFYSQICQKLENKELTIKEHPEATADLSLKQLKTFKFAMMVENSGKLSEYEFGLELGELALKKNSQ